MDIALPNTPKKQHYVPQFLLKKFSSGKNHKIFAFDKSRATKFETNVRDIASEKGFYNFKIDGEKHTLEHKLSKLETICSSVVKKICDDQSLENITNNDLFILSVFAASLFLRVKKQRECIGQFNNELAEWLLSMGLNPDEVGNFEILDKEDIQEEHIEFTNDNVMDFSKYFYKRSLVLLKAPNESNFIISDNPVVLYNHWNEKFRGKGVAVPGVEIQLPLSNKLCLSFICPFYLDDLMEKLQLIASRKEQNLPIPAIDTSYAETLIHSIAGKKTVEVEAQHVVFSNSLQIADSLNYIYSNKSEFRLAEAMIKKNPSLANGKVIRMGIDPS